MSDKAVKRFGKQNMLAKSKIIFCDSSALIAGLVSPTGSMRVILDLLESKSFSFIISKQVLQETRENISKKFPEAVWITNKILPTIKIVSDPTLQILKKFKGLINNDDLPILVSAMSSNPDYLLTWDKKHFITPKIKKSVNFVICTPADFLQKYLI